jgi:hypothetical protein
MVGIESDMAEQGAPHLLVCHAGPDVLQLRLDDSLQALPRAGSGQYRATDRCPALTELHYRCSFRGARL